MDYQVYIPAVASLGKFMTIEQYVGFGLPGYSPDMKIYLIRSQTLYWKRSWDIDLLKKAEIYLTDPKMLPWNLDVDIIPAYGFFPGYEYQCQEDLDYAIEHPECQDFFSLAEMSSLICAYS